MYIVFNIYCEIIYTIMIDNYILCKQVCLKLHSCFRCCFGIDFQTVRIRYIVHNIVNKNVV